jgi:hypothetical protein
MIYGAERENKSVTMCNCTLDEVVNRGLLINYDILHAFSNGGVKPAIDAPLLLRA